jgi:hypothetical protein
VLRNFVLTFARDGGVPAIEKYLAGLDANGFLKPELFFALDGFARPDELLDVFAQIGKVPGPISGSKAFAKYVQVRLDHALSRLTASEDINSSYNEYFNTQQDMIVVDLSMHFFRDQPAIQNTAKAYIDLLFKRGLLADLRKKAEWLIPSAAPAYFKTLNVYRGSP